MSFAWRDIIILAILGMGWVFLFIAVFAGAVKLVSLWLGKRGGEEEKVGP